jgi:hypothetical protein
MSPLSGSGLSLQPLKRSIGLQLLHNIDDESDAMVTEPRASELNRFGDFAGWRFDAVELHTKRLIGGLGIGPDQPFVDGDDA